MSVLNGIVRTAATMYDFFAYSKTQGSYLILFFISIFLLYCLNKSENRWFVYYAIILMLLVVANPLTVYLLTVLFPAMESYTPIVVLLPVLIYIPFTVAELLGDMAPEKRRLIIIVALLFYISICGNIAGFFRGDTMTEEYRYDLEKRTIVDTIAGKEPTMVLSCDGLIPFISVYTDTVPLLYGVDLWTPGMDTGIMDEYGEDIYLIHELMKNPKENLHSIVYWGMEYGCDIIVLDRYEKPLRFCRGYRLVGESESYLIYGRK